MIVTANDVPRTVILVLPAKKHLFPMSTAALSMTQGAKKSIFEDYQDALILDQDGTVFGFDKIEFVGLYGTSPGAKILSFLTRARTLSVALSPRPVPLDELKSLILDCVLSGRDFINEDADEAERHKLANAVEAAPDTIALYRTFKLPAPEDALDQL